MSGLSVPEGLYRNLDWDSTGLTEIFFSDLNHPCSLIGGLAWFTVTLTLPLTLF